MTQEQQIVKQIQQKLASAQIERNDSLEDLASQYTMMCETVQERLSRCMDYLSKGMRSEAVNEAGNEPNLLEYIDMLNFEGVEKWYNLCIDLELSVPPQIDKEACKRLKEAVTTEEGLAPLMREYRRSVYVGDHELSVQLLRKIREKDPANPSWAVNLKPLEEELMPEQVWRTEVALQKLDIRELRRMYAEFTNPQRATEPPADIMRKLKTALLSERASDLNREASNLMRKLQFSTSEEDVTSTEALLESAKKLSEDEAFIDVPGAWNAVLAAAREMLDLQARRNEKKAAFLKEVETFQNNLNAGTLDEITLRHAWEHVLSWQIPVSDVLRRQVEETLAEKKAAKERRKRLLSTSIAAIVVLLLAAGIALYLVTARRNRHNATLAHVQELYSKEEYNKVLDYISLLGTQDPAFAASPEILDFKRKAQDEIKHKEDLASNYKDVLDELESIRRRGFSSANPVRVTELLGNGLNIANELKDNGKANRIKNWKQAYQEWNDKRIHDASSAVVQWVASVQAAIKEAKAHPFANYEDELAKIAELSGRKEEALQYLANAGEYDKTSFAEWSEKLQAWERAAQEKASQKKALEDEVAKLRQDIVLALPDLVKYRTLLQRYIEIAPKNDELVLDYKRLLANYDLYLSVPVLNTFKLEKIPPTAEECDKIDALLEGSVRGTIWEGSLKMVRQLGQAKDDIVKEILGMSSDTPELTDFFYIEYKEKGAQEWLRLYSPAMLNIGPDKENPEFTKVFGRIYHVFPGSDKVVLAHTNDVFGKNFTSEKYDFHFERKKEDNYSEYRKFLEQFVFGANEGDDIVAYLIQAMERLKSNTAMELIPKAVAFRRITQMLDRNYGELVPEFKELADLFKNIDVTVPWMNALNPAVVQENAKVKGAIASLPDLNKLKTVFKERCDEYLNVINGQYSCAGSIVFVDGGPAIKLIASVDRPLESIIGFPSPKLFVVSKDGHIISSEAREHIINGMPLFIRR
ncbi:MAG: hypothetical protein IKS20_03715 [Victivallales bacterium]|nr:hypothetical protein [Victivallales bacterium]